MYDKNRYRTRNKRKLSSANVVYIYIYMEINLAKGRSYLLQRICTMKIVIEQGIKESYRPPMWSPYKEQFCKPKHYARHSLCYLEDNYVTQAAGSTTNCPRMTKTVHTVIVCQELSFPGYRTDQLEASNASGMLQKKKWSLCNLYKNYVNEADDNLACEEF